MGSTRWNRRCAIYLVIGKALVVCISPRDFRFAAVFASSLLGGLPYGITHFLSAEVDL